MIQNFITDIFEDTFIVKVKLSRATLNEARELLEILLSALQKKFDKIIIEMDEVEFIDSTFLGTLTVTQKKLKEFNGNLALVGLNPDVNSVVERTNLDKVFKIYKNRFQALQSISSDDGYNLSSD